MAKIFPSFRGCRSTPKYFLRRNNARVNVFFDVCETVERFSRTHTLSFHLLLDTKTRRNETARRAVKIYRITEA